MLILGTRTMINQAQKAAVGAAADEIENFFDVGPNITGNLAAAARRGLLPLDDSHRLAAQFAERLRVQPQLSWIGYGDAASGRYAGATRWDDGEIVEYVADPAVNNSMPDQVAIAEDGTKSPPKFAETQPWLVPLFGRGSKKASRNRAYWTCPADDHRRVRRHLHDGVYRGGSERADRRVSCRFAAGRDSGLF